MAKIKFDKPDRFDAIRAEKGVEHTIIHQNGTNYGTFKTSLNDDTTKVYRLALERFSREHGNDPEANGDYAGVYMFVMTCMHDWKGVTSNGVEVPFSKEAAFEFLIQDVDNDSWLFNQLLARSKNDIYYQKVGDPRASQKEAVKN